MTETRGQTPILGILSAEMRARRQRRRRGGAWRRGSRASILRGARVTRIRVRRHGGEERIVAHGRGRRE